MLKLLQNPTQSVSTFASATNGTAVSDRRTTALSVQCNVTVNTASAKAFTAANATSIFTASSHGLVTGQKLQVSNSGGALPTGLLAVTDYFVIKLTANTFKLATSLNNALAGTNLTISDDGSGTNTETPTSLAGATVQLFKSNDNSTFYADGSTVSVTATGTYWLEKTISTALYYRVQYAITAGSMTSSEVWCLLGETI